MYLYHAATKPLRPELRQQILKTQMCFTDVRKSGGFSRLDSDGRLIPGGAVFAFGNKQAFSERHARSRLKLLFPQPTDDDVELGSYWEGYCAVTDTFLPHVQRLGKNVFAVGGFSTRGVNLAQNLGRSAENSPVAGHRLMNSRWPLSKSARTSATGPRLILPYYKAKDRVGLS
ncbi:MAG: FAD-dependent oxidoreductase [Pararhizobium sp.]